MEKEEKSSNVPSASKKEANVLSEGWRAALDRRKGKSRPNP